MFLFRFLLGFGIGPKSATIPIYASECAPANVRGALVMMWQVFTTFGIMCGYLAGAAFRNVLDGSNNTICPPAGKLTYTGTCPTDGSNLIYDGTSITQKPFIDMCSDRNQLAASLLDTKCVGASFFRFWLYLCTLTSLHQAVVYVHSVARTCCVFEVIVRSLVC